MEGRIQKSIGVGYSILVGFQVLTKEGNLIDRHSVAKGNWDWELTYWKIKQEAEQFLDNYLKGKTMATLTCKDGTVIKISDETEDSLRKAFGLKLPRYEDGDITVKVNVNSGLYPIEISTDGGGEEISRDVEDTEAFIVALQTAVTYCKQHNLGV